MNNFRFIKHPQVGAGVWQNIRANGSYKQVNVKNGCRQSRNVNVFKFFIKVIFRPSYWGLEMAAFVRRAMFWATTLISHALGGAAGVCGVGVKAFVFHNHTVRRHQRAIANVGAVKQNGVVTPEPQKRHYLVNLACHS